MSRRLARFEPISGKPIQRSGEPDGASIQRRGPQCAKGAFVASRLRLRTIDEMELEDGNG
jgi:hypothetical protein